METSNSTGGPMQGSSTNSSRRTYNMKSKKKKVKMKTMQDVLQHGKKNIKFK
jgi:hypothetical protein|tara:strand:+ start:3418 stop:3573 length:156 start_codon:yes stop_codon:yes gene_type:complete